MFGRENKYEVTFSCYHPVGNWLSVASATLMAVTFWWLLIDALVEQGWSSFFIQHGHWRFLLLAPLVTIGAAFVWKRALKHERTEYTLVLEGVLYRLYLNNKLLFFLYAGARYFIWMAVFYGILSLVLDRGMLKWASAPEGILIFALLFFVPGASYTYWKYHKYFSLASKGMLH